MTQARPGIAVKQEQEQNSRNQIQAFLLVSVCNKQTFIDFPFSTMLIEIKWIYELSEKCLPMSDSYLATILDIPTKSI